MKKNINLPLFDLFNRLRERGFILGVDDYTLLLHALRSGQGVEEINTVKNLCATLWAKSEAENQILIRLFNQIVGTKLETDNNKLKTDNNTSNVPGYSYLENSNQEPTFRAENSEKSKADISNFSQVKSQLSLEEPPQVVQAIRRTGQVDDNFRRSEFSFVNDYFPITRRQMKQAWRHLRRMVREGPLDEIDLDATIEKIGVSGILSDLVFVPRRVNRASLVIFIDQDGSMTPFQKLTRDLVISAYKGGRLNQRSTFYFHNCPDDYIYTDTTRVNSIEIYKALSELDEKSVALIVSDGGAARGNYNSSRVQATRKFVNQLKKSILRCAWLNPMPKERWQNNTAVDISDFIPMFEMSRMGLENAISFLRGKYNLA